MDLVSKIGLEVHGHPIPYTLGRVNKEVEIKVMKQCKIEFSISVDFFDDMELDVLSLDIYGVLFGIPYMYIRDAIFMERANQYILIKDGNSYIINVHKGKSNISLISANQFKKLISSSMKYVSLLLREN
jgi:hypothetical protein